MLKDIVEVRALDGHQLYLRFDDGTNGIVNLDELVSFQGVFEPLKDRTHFEQVNLNRELGTIYWPTGADLDPDVLYAIVSGRPIPSYQDKARR